ncbi:MAG: PspC domain-containing protein [Chloroflexota bacterium]|nr:PspC domain-containing protein [Chloroflexota bacterium]
MADRLYRSRDERVISGVAGGIAENLDLDPTIVRLAWVGFALVTGGIALVVYFVMIFIVPEEPAGAAGSAAAASGGSPVGVDTNDGGRAEREARRAARRAERAARWRERGRNGPLVVGLILVLAGAWLLVRRYVPELDTSLLWPYALVILGAILIVVALRPGGRSGE